MIKFSLGYVEKREATVIGLGLTEANLIRMHDQNDPVYVRGSDLDLPEPGVDLVILSGDDQEMLALRTQEFLAKYPIAPSQEIPYMIFDKIYVAPIVSESGKMLLLVGFDHNSLTSLRNRDILKFRMRVQEGEGTPVECLFFWGPNEDIMAETFYAQGLISDRTKIVRS